MIDPSALQMVLGVLTGWFERWEREAIACNTLVVSAHADTTIDAAIEAASFLLSADAGYITAEVIDCHRPSRGTSGYRGVSASGRAAT